jgi:hypothetical protein
MAVADLRAIGRKDGGVGIGGEHHDGWRSCCTTRLGSWRSTVAFALFEVSTVFQLHDLHTLDASIKSEIGADKLIKRGCLVLVISSLINFLSVLYFLALAWHSASGSGASFPLDHLPSPWNWLHYAVHALAFTLVLFLAGDLRRATQERQEGGARDTTGAGAAGA